MIAKNLSTTPTIALFLILAATGILLLMHTGGGNVKMLHEWLGIAFIVFALLHSAANWPLMKRYLGGAKAMIIATIVLASVTFSMVAPGKDHGINPIKSTYRQVIQAPIDTLALLYALEPQNIVDRLQNAGYVVESLKMTPQEIARQSDVSADRVLAVIVADEEH